MKTTTAAALVTVVASMFANCGSAEKSGSTRQAVVKCEGVNECRGQGQCGGTFTDGGLHGCAGENECKGQGWVEVSADECTTKGGRALR